MIRTGEKTKEYRDKKNYWRKRLFVKKKSKKFDFIIFRNGYSKNAPEMKIVCKKVYETKKSFVIDLGKIIYVKNLKNQFNKK